MATFNRVFGLRCFPTLLPVDSAVLGGELVVVVQGWDVRWEDALRDRDTDIYMDTASGEREVRGELNHHIVMIDLISLQLKTSQGLIDTYSVFYMNLYMRLVNDSCLTCVIRDHIAITATPWLVHVVIIHVYCSSSLREHRAENSVLTYG